MTPGRSRHRAANRRLAIRPLALRPGDGRFGSGPSKVRAEQLARLAGDGAALMGTSHRQAPVRALVGRVRAGLSELFAPPDGYAEVVLGNGGSGTAFWEIAAFGLVPERARTTWSTGCSRAISPRSRRWRLSSPIRSILRARARRARCGPTEPSASPDGADVVDALVVAHNETSTGVMIDEGRRAPPGAGDALVLVDGTSGAGGLARSTPTQADAYYFAPQKSFGSDGGL